ncbi:hypothetical protein UZS95_24285 [Parabacteroides goldsteinii]|nr:hypothetical protein [Parabacteroides goldsteinii]MDZ3929489.1 hypothetical protein [Parabacteroides goldsteinii]
MNVLETILNFLTSLARIIFPRKRKPAAGDCPCPHPLPAPTEPPLPPDAGDGSNPDLYRSDTLALGQGDWGTRQEKPPARSRLARNVRIQPDADGRGWVFVQIIPLIGGMTEVCLKMKFVNSRFPSFRGGLCFIYTFILSASIPGIRRVSL